MISRSFRCCALLALVASSALAAPASLDSRYPSPQAEFGNPEHWRRLAQRDIQQADEQLKRDASPDRRTQVARNLVLFIGDGMGVPTITAGRILSGQLDGESGEERTLAFEQFERLALIKTYSVDHQTADSAATATAFLTGVKANSGTVGVNQLAHPDNCSSYSPQEHDVASILSLALADTRRSRRVGLVTTTRVTHATPSAAYAHCVSREWESDTDRATRTGGASGSDRCPDIALQLVANALNFSVVFGGGRAKFRSKADNGSRSDGRNLISEWLSAQRNLGRRSAYMETRDELNALDTSNVDFALGLFADSHLEFEATLAASNIGQARKQPTLAEMTAKAIKLLSQSPDGFVLLVEGGNIDNGHHRNYAKKALHELIGLNAAVQAALKLVSLEDTLVTVTADHSHVFSIGGFGIRGNPLFGKNLDTYLPLRNSRGHALAEDGKPFMLLYYGDGASAVTFPGGRADLTDVDTGDPNYRVESLVKMKVESHGGEDVPLYASGPGSYLFHSTHEQSYLAHAFMHATCIGAYADREGCGATGLSATRWLLLTIVAIATAFVKRW